MEGRPEEKVTEEEIGAGHTASVLFSWVSQRPPHPPQVRPPALGPRVPRTRPSPELSACRAGGAASRGDMARPCRLAQRRLELREGQGHLLTVVLLFIGFFGRVHFIEVSVTPAGLNLFCWSSLLSNLLSGTFTSFFFFKKLLCS